MRCLVVSDIHSNLDALEAVVADAGAVDRVWCLGDIVDGGPRPNECVDLLRRLEAVSVAGNHDRWVLGDFGPDIRANAAVMASNDWTISQLRPDNLAYLAALPERVVVGNVTLIHTLSGDLHPPKPAHFATFATPYCLVGHTHTRFVALPPGSAADPFSPEAHTTIELADGSSGASTTEGRPVARAVVNPGAVSRSFTQTRLAEYMLYDLDERTGAGTLTQRMVSYSMPSVIEQLRAAGAPATVVAGWEAYARGQLAPVMREAVANHYPWVLPSVR